MKVKRFTYDGYLIEVRAESIIFFMNKERHRVNGPAYVNTSPMPFAGSTLLLELYYLNGVNIIKEEHSERTNNK